MWPPSLETASAIAGWANVALILSLAIGVVATVLIVWTGNIKEEHWDDARRQSGEKVAALSEQAEAQRKETALANERAAKAALEAEKLKGDNLALQSAMAPRHVARREFDGSGPKSFPVFLSLKQFAGTEVLIDSIAPEEPRQLAQEIATMLTHADWRPSVNRSWDGTLVSVSSEVIEGVAVWYPAGLEQPAKALAETLSKCGLGIGGMLPVLALELREGSQDPFMPHFSQPLKTLFVQIGRQPIASTLEWIKAGRPTTLGTDAAKPQPR